MAKSWQTIAVATIALALGGGSFALAQEAGITGIAFTDPQAALQREAETSFSLNAREDRAERFAPSPDPTEANDQRKLELEFAATGDSAGLPLDVSVARRASLGADENGDLDRTGSGSEVRIGRGLVQRNDGDARQGSSVYMFVASDDEALTWRPGQRNELGGQGSGFALQDQVEIGDVSAGVTYERNGVQASLAYVEREISTQVGRDSYTTQENFAGVTVTMRR